MEKGLRARHATAQPHEGGRAAGCPGYTARDAQIMIPGRWPPGAPGPAYASGPGPVVSALGSAYASEPELLLNRSGNGPMAQRYRESVRLITSLSFWRELRTRIISDQI